MTRESAAIAEQGLDALRYEGSELEVTLELNNYQRWVAQHFLPYLGQRTAEIGAGIGAISRWLVPLVERIDLIEPSPNLAQCLEEKFAGTENVRVVAGSLKDYVANAPPDGLDSVLMVNVLEHIENDAEALGLLRSLVRPGGHILVFVPALPCLYSPIDEVFGHHRRYTRARLSDCAAAAGFEIVMVRYFDMLGIVPWSLIHTIGRRKKFHPAMARIYDRFCVPVIRTMEAVVSPAVGKNLILIAKRPEPEARGR